MEICTDCGKEFENEGCRRKPYCIDCGFARMRDAAEQMSKKEGPYYEKWLLAKDKAVKNYRARMERTIKRYEESLTWAAHLATPEGQAEMIVRVANLVDKLEDAE